MSTFQVSSISTNIFSSNIGCTITPFDFSELRCQCLIDTRTQLWSIVKEKWKSSTSISPEFSKEFFIMYGKGCSVAIDRKTILFIGGHHLYKLQDSDIEHEFVPINNPFNDLVYQYNFMDRKWTELPKVPNVKVVAIIHGRRGGSCLGYPPPEKYWVENPPHREGYSLAKYSPPSEKFFPHPKNSPPKI